MKRLLTILPIVLLLACEDVIPIELPGDPDLLVIEGWLMDTNQRQLVTITRTNGFSSSEPVPKVDDAEVKVISNSGLEFPFTNSGDGQYFSNVPFGGEYGVSYQLIVVLAEGDTIISAPEVLTEVSDIDSLSFNFFVTQDEENPRLDITVYYPIAFSADPAEETNFYKWNVFRNNMMFDSPEQIILLEDRFINGNDFRNDFTAFEFSEFDTARVEIQSLSSSVFNFFTLFRSQVVSLGTSSGSQPASLVGNLENISNPNQQILGFFGASSVKSREIVILP